MIISHKYKFIFIKTTKTAGTSTEIALSKHCGDKDILTPLGGGDERDKNDADYRGAQNYLAPPWAYDRYDVAQFLLPKPNKHRRKLKYNNHMSAEKVKDNIGDEIWDSYYKFCFERNPWDRFISFYYWRCKKMPRPTIDEFISTGVASSLKKMGYNKYTIGGQVAVDKVCRFENITDELENIRQHLGIPEPLVLPYAKSQHRKDKRSYRDILNEEQKEIIADTSRDVINLMGYEF